MSNPTLFERLGGYEGITGFVEDVMPRIREDAQLGRFYINRGTDGIEREQQFLVDFLCASANGTMYYKGRAMAATHRGMNIGESDWSCLLDHLCSSMNNLQVPQQERAELMEFILSLKTDIVGI